ncbi:MAG: hypothetical protein PHX08_08115 [Lachnospiraceae bacterium]|nr:hypothetical protein [Lachnospiraceae bacterium]
MYCKLSWMYPTSCVHECNGECDADRNCEWKSEQSFEEYVKDHENDDSK